MKLFRLTAMLCLTLGAASPASAIILNSIEVGGIDTIISITNDTGDAGSIGTGATGCASSSGDTAERCWAEAVLGGTTLTQTSKPGDVGITYDTDSATNTDILGSFSLTGNPLYFIVKNANVWILMENISELGWGVLNVSEAKRIISDKGIQKCTGNPSSPTCELEKLNLGDANQTTISHVTHYDGSNEVPEPTSLALLGSGLVVFGLSRRRNKHQI